MPLSPRQQDWPTQPWQLAARSSVQKVRGSGPKDGLLGFTGSTVTVRFGSVIYTYGDRGETVFAKAA